VTTVGTFGNGYERGEWGMEEVMSFEFSVLSFEFEKHPTLLPKPD
jgi:hypothetical protein